MSVPGEYDELYIEARSVLLDALSALQDHADSLILVGAQAIYIHCGEAEFAVAPYTKDADIVLDTRTLRSSPEIGDVLIRAGFVLGEQPGIWHGRDLVPVDLLAPETLAGAGRRGARLKGHHKLVARKVYGMEAALVDNAPHVVGSLEKRDSRKFRLVVAGPAALLVTKLHKLGERAEAASRLQDKDAMDVLRILQAISTQELVRGFSNILADDISKKVGEEAVDYLEKLFSAPDRIGSRMAGRSLEGLEDYDTVTISCASLAGDLLVHLSR
jgi:hypothetical protein